jgi:hypothetical protein
LRWFAATPCRATTEDHQPNRASPSISNAVTATPSPIFYIDLLVAYVAHPAPSSSCRY